MSDIIDVFMFPKESLISNKVPLKTIIDELNLVKADEKLLRTHVSSISLKVILDAETTLLKPLTLENYLYEEIQVFLVHLKSTDKIKTLHNKLHAIFPNPTIICTKFNNIYQVSASDKRINLTDSNLSVLEHVYLTDEIRLENLDKNFSNAINYQKHKYESLYHLYNHYQNAIYSHILIDLLGSYPKKLLSVDFIKEKLNKITVFDSEIRILEEGKKEALSLSEKMKFHKEIHSTERHREKIVNEIMEEINNER